MVSCGSPDRKRLGFRRVEVVGNELHVNGSPIRILGVNRHDARMDSGRSLTTEQFREDLLNFRRGERQHDPYLALSRPIPRLSELCDELGMYLFDQPPICWIGFLQANKVHHTAHFAPYLLEVTAETVRRDLHHPSVIVWDLANESEWSWAFAAQRDLVNELDAQRGRPSSRSTSTRSSTGSDWKRQARGPTGSSCAATTTPASSEPWPEDLERFSKVDAPVICDEYIPIIEACQRWPHEAFMLPIDPGVRDYWVTAIKPFMEQLFATRSCIGGMVWSGVDDLFAIPLDLKIGEGPWSHLAEHDFDAAARPVPHR